MRFQFPKTWKQFLLSKSGGRFAPPTAFIRCQLRLLFDLIQLPPWLLELALAFALVWIPSRKTNAIKSTNGSASVTDSITPVNFTVTDTSTQALEPLTDNGYWYAMLTVYDHSKNVLQHFSQFLCQGLKVFWVALGLVSLLPIRSRSAYSLLREQQLLVLQ